MPSGAARSLGIREWIGGSVLAIAVLCVLRPASITTPNWWDAGAVYAPGAHWLQTHGFDAQPGVFPADLSRGHTALFYVLLALASSVGGAGPAPGHVLVLAFAAATLVLTYALGTWIFNRSAGLLAATALAVTPLFLTISSDAYPEIPMMALTAAALYAYARGRLLESALWGTVLVLVKETGVAVCLAILGAILWDAWRHRRVRWQELAVASAPMAVLATFFLYQKHAEGWFVLPYHVDLFNERHDLLVQLRRVLFPVFVDHGRVVLTVSAIGLAGWRRISGTTAPSSTPAVRPTDSREPTRGAVFVALALVCLANGVFFAKMFFLERYVLNVHVPVVIVASGTVVSEVQHLRRSLRIAVPVAVAALTMLIAISMRSAGTDYASGETTFRYLDAVSAGRILLREFDRTPADPSTAVLAVWPMTDEIRAPFLGWVTQPHRALSLDYYVMPERDRAGDPRIVGALGYESVGGYRGLVREAQRLGFHRIRRVQVGGAAADWWGP